jgi:hypothetical protein
LHDGYSGTAAVFNLSISSNERPAVNPACPLIAGAFDEPQRIVASAAHLVRSLVGVSKAFPQSEIIVSSLVATQRSDQPFANITPKKIALGTIFSDFYYFVTDSRFDASLAREATIRISSMVWVVDFIIDDFGLPDEERLAVLEKFADTVANGTLYDFPFCDELTELSKQTRRLHYLLGDAPRGQMVVDAILNLAKSARAQINEAPTQELAEKIGAQSFMTLALVPFAWNVAAPTRILAATEKFGAALQLLDDYWDRERDAGLGIRTFATEHPDKAELALHVDARVRVLQQEMLTLLTPSEGRHFISFMGLVTGFYVTKEWVKKIVRRGSDSIPSPALSARTAP